MFENWSLSQYIVRFTSLNQWFIGIIMTLFGITSIFLTSIINLLFTSSPNDLVPGSFASFAGVFFLIIGIYSCITAYGLWNYKNYGRIMQLIDLYFMAVGLVIYLIISIITIFINPILGFIVLIIIAFFGFILYMLIYLFQKQKDVVALFKNSL